MKIGFDITALSMPKTGIGQYQYNLLQNLFEIDNRNQYHLYAFNLRDNSKYENIHFDFKHNNVSMKAHKIPQRLITAWWIMVRWPHLEKITDECDIYQISEICQQPTKKKSVAFIHDLTTIHYPKYHLFKNKFLYHHRFKNIKKHASAVLTNSEHTKKDIIENLGIEEDRIHVTYFGAAQHFKPIDDLHKIDEVLKKYKIDQPYLCYVGTIEPRKNLENLFKAFKKLKKEKDIPHKLVLVGKDGWFFENIYKKINELKLSDDVISTGFVPDKEIPLLLNGAEIFVYPSYYEGFGLPVLEAMSCGTPVVTSNTSSLPEVGGDAVKYFNPHSHEDLFNKIHTLLNSEEQKRVCSAKGLQQAKRFSWKKCAIETLKVYESLR